MTYPLGLGLAALSRHCFSLNNALSVSLIVVLDARGRARSADLHLDFGQPVLDLPLLLIQLDAHRRVLGLQTFQTLAETLNLRQQSLVRAEQRCRALAHQLSHTVAGHACTKEERIVVVEITHTFFPQITSIFDSYIHYIHYKLYTLYTLHVNQYKCIY